MAGLILVAAFSSKYLWSNYERLFDKEMIDKCGDLYRGTSLKRDKPFIFRFPLFIVHRLLFAILGCSLHRHPTFSIQGLIFVNLFYSMFRLAYRPNQAKSLVRLSTFSDVYVHMMLIQIFVFSDMTNDKMSLYYSSFGYLGALFLICFVYIVFFIHSGIGALIKYRRIRRQQRLNLSKDTKQIIENPGENFTNFIKDIIQHQNSYKRRSA